MLKLCNALDNYIPKGSIDINKEFQKSAQIHFHCKDHTQYIMYYVLLVSILPLSVILIFVLELFRQYGIFLFFIFSIMIMGSTITGSAITSS